MTMRMVPLLVVLALSPVALSSCASAPIQKAVVGETAAVQAVHVVITAEKAAFDAKAFTQAQHNKNLAAFKKVLDVEKALNDALIAWAKTQNQPMPTAVVTAIQALTGVLADIQPLVSTNSAVATVASNLTTALSLLAKGA